MRAQFRKRLRILLGVLGAIALIIVGRLYYIQIIDGGYYNQRATDQYTASASTLYDRGSIYFTRKDGTLVAAATLKTGYLIAINPELLTNSQTAYRQLNAITPIDKKKFFADAAKTHDPYEEIAHKVSTAAGNAIAAKRIPGVMVIHERWRSYPGGTLAAHALGFLGYDNTNTISGQYGLERYYNSILDRTGNTYRNFFAQLFSNLGDVFVNANSSREGDIVTTIEPEVESRLMTDLAGVQKKYHSKETGGIIMDPKTGAIIALGSLPTYNPNDFQHATTTDFGNPLVEHVYEFGSIVKALTMASGLSAGVITPQTTYNDTGCIHVDGRRICNWDLKARGVIPMKQIIIQSLNVGASWIADRLGEAGMRKYFTSLFGQKSGVDLPSESDALINNLHSKQLVDYDTASFGQGIATTPMEMIRALAAIANGGVMPQPHLASKEILLNGTTRTFTWDKTKRVFTAQAAHDTATMMDDLMDQELYHGAAKIPTMSVAVKTGTAQLTKPGGGYYLHKFFHSFVGFFPSHNPRFIILLYTKDPTEPKDPYAAEYAAQTLAPSFLDLTHFLIDYYHIPPDRGVPSASNS